MPAGHAKTILTAFCNRKKKALLLVIINKKAPPKHKRKIENTKHSSYN